VSFEGELAETASLRKAGILRRLYPLLAPHRVTVDVVLVGLVLIVAVDILQPWFVKQIIDRGALAGDARELAWWLWVYALTLLATGALSALTGYLSLATGQRLMAALRRMLYERFLALPMAYFDRMPAGKTLARMINDPDHIGEPLAQGFTLVFGRALLVVCTVGAMFWLHWRLSWPSSRWWSSSEPSAGPSSCAPTGPAARWSPASTCAWRSRSPATTPWCSSARRPSRPRSSTRPTTGIAGPGCA
jgi:hypothetical protein